MSSVSFGQEDTINQIDKDTGKKIGYWILYGKDKPESGFCDTCIVSEGPYVNYRKHGIWKKYYKSGQLKLLGNYEYGRPNGYFEKYYPNGMLRERGTYGYRHYIGTHEKYYPSGCIELMQFLDSIGKEQGKQYFYYDICDSLSRMNGQLEIEYFARDGVAIDTMKHYYPNGDIKQISVLDEGSGDMISSKQFDRVNPPVEYSEKESVFDSSCVIKYNEKIYFEGICKDHKYWTGKQYKYDKEGWLIGVQQWVNGSEIVPGEKGEIVKCVLRDSNQEIFFEGTCKDGVPWLGKYYTYDDDGILINVKIIEKGNFIPENKRIRD